MQALPIIGIAIAMLLLTACADEGGGGGTPDPGRTPTTVPLQCYISLPATTRDSRMGDPGSPTGEDVDWDRLTVIVAYRAKAQTEGDYDPQPGKMVYWDTFTRQEFESATSVVHPGSTLSPVLQGGTDTGLRTFTMPLPVGTARVYGITYSSPTDPANASRQAHLVDFEARLKQLSTDGTDHNADILAWPMPNDYATTASGQLSTIDVAKFISVATGYAVNSKAGTTSPYDLSIAKANEVEMKQYWSMTLRRIAAKLDLQWDAQAAYDNTTDRYTDVLVNAFAYDGGATLADGGAGAGLVFPYAELHEAGHTFQPLGGKVEFFNTSPISQRNGRVYHYLFPDLSSTVATPPRIDFNITATYTDDNGHTATRERTFSYNFQKVAPIQPATWYKISTRIRGNKQDNADITIDHFETGN